MIYGMYSIFDTVAGAYTAPFISVNDAVAKRQFAQNFYDHGSVMGMNPADFRLMRIGDYDIQNGTVFAKDHEVVINGAECMAMYEE